MIEQLFLLEAGELPEIDRTQPKFESTGERFERDHPDLCDIAVEMMAERVPIREISRRLHTSQNTLRAVAMRKRIPIDAARQVIVDASMFAMRLAVEGMTADLMSDKPPAFKDKAVGFGILSQNSQLLSGGATVRLERMESSEDIYAGFERLHARLVESLQIGSAGENPPVNGRPGELGAGSLAGSVIDAESDDPAESFAAAATDSAADRPERGLEIEPDGPAADGGGGGSSQTAAAMESIDHTAQNFIHKGEESA